MSAPTFRPGTDPALLVCPCTYGPCGHCSTGSHDRCAFRLGTAPEREASTWITDRRGYVPYFPAGHKPEMPRVYILGGHTWHCPCDSAGHGLTTTGPQQLDLFGEVTA